MQKMVTNLGEDFHRFNRDMVAGVFNQVTNEQGFDQTSNIWNNGVLGQISGNDQFRADLINRSSLVAGNFANMRQRLTKFNLFGASQKFGRGANSLDLFRGFDHGALQFDDFPSLVHVSEFNLSVENELQS